MKLINGWQEMGESGRGWMCDVKAHMERCGRKRFAR